MKRIFSFLLLLSMVLIPAAGFAADEKNGPAPMDEKKMAEIQKYSTPGENHAKLEPFTGNWKYTSTWRMSADAQPETSEGTTEAKWILDKHFIQQNVKGKAMGKDFEGVGILGYDNVKEEYTSVWLDTMSTGIMVSSGKYDDAAKTLTENGKFSCPVTGKKDMEARMVTKWVDNDHYTMEMYTKDEHGKEYKSMEMQYERK